jgi:hypothetical protein
MERLELQYKLTLTSSIPEKEELTLDIANKFLNQGDYQNGIAFIEKINPNSNNVDFKKFLSGKAEFLIDNYKRSLIYLNSIDEKRLNKEYYWELQVYKVLNYNHLLQIDSSYNELSQLILQNNQDTSGLYLELNAIIPPKYLDLRKANRRSRLFPGAGLSYVGERKKAVTSAFLQFAFIGYAAYSIYTKYYFTAALTGGAQFLRFYNGSKRASIKIASKKNREAYINYVLKIDACCQKKILGLSKINN